ncbi:type I-E CRISPR-associated protein Cas7/Cse4/CasC [Actinobacteria bacterium YIM 96077]|uniref:Type I-E CRISPR-associated protein Cas7/Cse4/CasC n=1 Tax=Phytoactinopolyspora halophila TaxID=1981511 RepID=A0A329QJW6_9ACTN|nr:type I-E CRISPR-associated protein Cas7/Cse4/CasC [Phytoactinopolyspora halophila]AYY12433.1 type I-E CRISPR-associated protein Cas7/Cse4/CasC [Actinobacteria bacterium YIM 96077]RAW11989.1 type I-E CRISPR-associated protein Cas7/Cse4/CasC [Phytoactinopolyspora halophila]
MSRTIIDVHILQTVPPSNLNRDDTGSPKTAVYGGVRRARVSSQAWKRATRVDFQDKIDPSELGVRTRRVVELLAEEIRRQEPALEERAHELAVATFKAVGIEVKAPKKDATEESGYLVFLSRRQIESLARAAVEASDTDDVGKALKEAKVKDLADRDHSIAISLFGRMVADQADLNVDASAQVAHAISVHPVETEFDYFTAVDDTNPEEETGAGMIGTVEFNSSTLYRYATVDVNRLAENLGDVSATRRAVETFVESFVRSMPTGKQNTFANRTLPEAVVVMVRDSQPVNLVGAFENPVRESEVEGRIKRASQALRDEASEIERAYAESPVASWVTRVGDDTSSLDDLGGSVPLGDLVSSLGTVVESRLGSGE